MISDHKIKTHRTTNYSRVALENLTDESPYDRSGGSTKVSVCIATHNAARYISEALSSLRSQRFRSWELIVVEDGTHDETENLVFEFRESIANNVIFRRLPVNRGVSFSRNVCASLASSTFLAFLDADDIWRADHLEQMLLIQLNSNADLVSTCVTPFSGQITTALPSYPGPSLPSSCSAEAIFAAEYCIVPSGMLLKREIFLRAAGFDENFRKYEDRELLIRLLVERCNFAYSPEQTLYYRKHDGAATTDSIGMAEGLVQVYLKHRNQDAIPAYLRRRMLARSYRDFARLMKKTSPQCAIWNLYKAIRVEPFCPKSYLHVVHATGYMLTTAIRRNLKNLTKPRNG